MTTLFTATLELSKILQNTVESVATGGSTTTLEDSARGEYADYFDGGTIWFISGNNASKSAVIADWITTKFTFATQAGACAAGNKYAASPARSGAEGGEGDQNPLSERPKVCGGEQWLRVTQQSGTISKSSFF